MHLLSHTLELGWYNILELKVFFPKVYVALVDFVYYIWAEREEQRHAATGLGLGMEPRMTELRSATSAYETSAVPFGVPNCRGTTCAHSKYRSQSSCFHKAKYFSHQ